MFAGSEQPRTFTYLANTYVVRWT